MRQKNGGWAAVVIGTVLLIAGLAWGLIGSHQDSYVKSQPGVNYDPGFGETSGNLYFHAPDSSDYFIAYSTDFSPAITQSVFNSVDHYAFVARPDTSDPQVTLNGTTIDSAHKIEKLTLYAQNGSVIATYTTAEYRANPNGIYISAWSNAGWLAGFGLLMALAGLLQAFRAPKTSFRISGSTAMPSYQPIPPSYPSVQPGASPYQQPPTDPYAQPYQNPGQYPSIDPYAQPYNNPNPYQQPPQR
jgi:hypothetical protein